MSASETRGSVRDLAAMEENPGDHDRSLMAAVARAHYLEDRSRVEIAEEFGISRFKVTRLLKRARDEGVVTIQVNDVGLPDIRLAKRLKKALGLQACVVVRSHGSEDSRRYQVGTAAAEHLSSTLHDDDTLGVAWGRTLTATAQQLTSLPQVSLVQLSGFVADNLSSPIAIMSRVAALTQGRVYPIFAPLYIADKETADGLRRHPDISRAMQQFSSITTALLSVGSWEPEDNQVREVLPEKDLDNALAKGVYADVAGLLLTRDGQLVDPEFQDRCITIPADVLERVPRKIGVAAGSRKAGAIGAAVHAGLINEVVTDHELAQTLLALLDDCDQTRPDPS